MTNLAEIEISAVRHRCIGGKILQGTFYNSGVITWSWNNDLGQENTITFCPFCGRILPKELNHAQEPSATTEAARA